MPMFKDKEEGLYQNQAEIGIKDSSYKEEFDREESKFVRSNTKEDISKRHTGLRHFPR
jgi:hypothetical protein